MPESPRFLISKKRFEEARVVFKWIGKQNGVADEVVNERLDEICFEGEDRSTNFENLIRISKAGGNIKVSDDSEKSDSLRKSIESGKLRRSSVVNKYGKSFKPPYIR